MDDLQEEALFEKYLQDIDAFAEKLGVSRSYVEDEFLLEGQLPDIEHYLKITTGAK